MNKPNQNIQPIRVRAVVSVSGMARAVGLSRSRFWDHVRRGTFCKPEYSPTTKRPFYTAEAQEAIITARETGIGCNGEYVVFYERSAVRTPPEQMPTRNGIGDTTVHHGSDLATRLCEVGLVVTADQVQEAIAICFPNGTTGHGETAVLRAINRYLRRPSGAR
jgi:hypothetical protein